MKLFSKSFSIFLLLILPLISFSQSIEKDNKMGAESAKQVAQEMGIYQDSVLTAYVSAVGNRLVSNLDKNPFKFQFYVVDDPIPNAFALPGGFIYVSRGLLALIQNEDELACVLSHEIIHVEARHSVQQMKKGILPGIIELSGEAIASILRPNTGKVFQSAINAPVAIYMASYSRQHENEADSKGLIVASNAGYKPVELASILDRITKAVELLTKEKEARSFTNDHPYTPDRVANINAASKKLHGTPIAPIASNFPNQITGLLYGENPNNGTFVGNTFIQPSMNFKLTFPAEWEKFNESTMVGAVDSLKKAGIMVSLLDTAHTAQYYASEFEKEFEKKYKVKATSSKSYQVHANQGYLVTVSNDKVFYKIIWLRMGSYLLKFIEVSPSEQVSQLEKCVNSIAQCTNDDLRSIVVNKIVIVQAKENEKVDDFIKRTKQESFKSIFLVMNDLKTTSILKGSQYIKTIQQEAYLK